MQTDNKVLIGHVTITEEQVIENTFACAAWYEQLKIEPGVYPVYSVYKYNRTVYLADVPAIIIQDYFQSMFGGCPIGETYDVKKNAGKSTIHTLAVSPKDHYFNGWCSKWNFKKIERVA